MRQGFSSRVWVSFVGMLALLGTFASMGCSAGEAPSDCPEAPVTPATPAPEAELSADVAKPAAAVVSQLGHTTVNASDGHSISVWSKTPEAGDKRPVVLVHGRTWSGRPDFDLQVEGKSRSLMQRLAELGWPTYAIDLRGYGETPRDPSGFLTPSVAAEDLATVLAWVAEQHGGQAPALLGWSMGSLVSQLAVQRHPQAVHSVVLYGYPADPEAKRPKAKRPDEPERRATTVEAAKSDFIRPDVISDDVAEAFGEQAVRFDPVRVDWADGHEWNELQAAKVTVPTLMLQGAHDPYVKTGGVSQMFAELGTEDRQWVVIAGADHAAHLEDTIDEFVAALVAFWE